ncbi:hypothetical protein PsYK624_078240 [Phanerochaete sordida]|uniref:F-box domain-containing protein n=1 Tax=Phanerochaete sordida TaxID=48140 RepID=A0A9P3LEJ5_9APHY|nr:hypothetical protein PsYK624_078240 [Phanerochaete sordida]
MENVDVDSDVAFNVWCGQPEPFHIFVRFWAQLPPELQRGIFELMGINEDKVTMSRLCLVSKAWCRRFRAPIFSHLELKTVEDCQMLYRIIQSPLSAWLSAHVSALTIHITCFPHPTLWIPLLRLLPACRTIDASTYVPHLPLRRMTHSSDVKSALQNITTLKLFHCHFFSFSVLVRVLGDITLLEAIDLSEVTWSGHFPLAAADAHDICSGGFSHLRWVDVASCTNNMAVAAWTLSAASTRHTFTRGRSDDQVFPAVTWAIIDFMCTLLDDEKVRNATFSVTDPTADAYVFTGSVWAYTPQHSSRTGIGNVSISTARSSDTVVGDAGTQWTVRDVKICDSETADPDSNYGSRISYLDTRNWTVLAPLLDAFSRLQSFTVGCLDDRPEDSFQEVSDRVLSAANGHPAVTMAWIPDV